MTKWRTDDPPKDREFLAKDEIGYYVARYYSEGHPIHNGVGYQSVICTCCEEQDRNVILKWAEIND